MDRKSQKKFDNFLKAQKRFYETAKWFEGIKRKSDPTEKYVEELVEKEGKIFRRRWNVSKCTDCNKANKCGDLLKTKCSEFEEINDNNSN